MSTRITVEEIEQPREGAKMGSVKAGGRYYKVFPSKEGWASLANFAIGQSYDIETETNEFKGKTYHKIKSAKLANGNGASREDDTNYPPQGGAYVRNSDDARHHLMRAANLLKMCHAAAAAVIGDDYDGEDARTLFIDAQRAGYVAAMPDKPERKQEEPMGDEEHGMFVLSTREPTADEVTLANGGLLEL